jgi:hypothetical protein
MELEVIPAREEVDDVPTVEEVTMAVEIDELEEDAAPSL